jgi:hypothetical protein
MFASVMRLMARLYGVGDGNHGAFLDAVVPMRLARIHDTCAGTPAKVRVHSP